MKSFYREIMAVFGIACLCLLPGCASTQAPAYQTSPSTTQTDLANSGLLAGSVNPDLEALWSARHANSKDFAVGPGDVLEIKVPGVKELEDQTVRVDGKGDIDLPLLGSMHVAGLSESELDSDSGKKTWRLPLSSSGRNIREELQQSTGIRHRRG